MVGATTVRGCRNQRFVVGVGSSVLFGSDRCCCLVEKAAESEANIVKKEGIRVVYLLRCLVHCHYFPRVCWRV